MCLAKLEAEAHAILEGPPGQIPHMSSASCGTPYPEAEMGREQSQERSSRAALRLPRSIVVNVMILGELLIGAPPENPSPKDDFQTLTPAWGSGSAAL